MAEAARWTAARKLRLVFVVAGGDGTKLLEPGKEVLDEMARFVEFPVIVPWDVPVGLGWDDGGLAGLGERGEDALIGIECLVCDQSAGPH